MFDSPRKILSIVVLAVFVIVGILVLSNSFVSVDAREIVVVQSPIAGDLTVHLDPGTKWQGFGKVTRYPRRDQYSFSSAKDIGKEHDQSIKTGFNDGGQGRVSGVVSWEMPLQADKVIRLHKEYNSFHAIDQQLIRPMLEKVIFSAGATMSSIESSSERRPEIPQAIDDQMQNGPYLTTVTVQNQKDPITGVDRAVRAVSVSVDKDGKPLRASASTIKEYGITLSPVTVNDIVYEESVKNQIAERQKSTQAVQLSIAAAVRASQDALTTEKTGQAKAATARWEQEAIKAKVVTEAQQKLDVATLAAKEAEQYKREQILRGEGDSQRRQLVMAADGALDQKLATYQAVQEAWAKAFAAHEGPMVPGVMLGGSGGGITGASAGANIQSLVDLTTLKVTKDMGLDTSIAGAAQTAKKK